MRDQPLNDPDWYARWFIDESAGRLSLEMVKALVPGDVVSLFAIHRDQFSDHDLAELLSLVSEMLLKRALHAMAGSQG
jgi:hypothetical protein